MKCRRGNAPSRLTLNLFPNRRSDIRQMIAVVPTKTVIPTYVSHALEIQWENPCKEQKKTSAPPSDQFKPVPTPERLPSFPHCHSHMLVLGKSKCFLQPLETSLGLRTHAQSRMVLCSNAGVLLVGELPDKLW